MWKLCAMRDLDPDRHSCKGMSALGVAVPVVRSIWSPWCTSLMVCQRATLARTWCAVQVNVLPACPADALQYGLCSYGLVCKGRQVESVVAGSGVKSHKAAAVSTAEGVWTPRAGSPGQGLCRATIPAPRNIRGSQGFKEGERLIEPWSLRDL